MNSSTAIKSTDFEYRGKGGDHALQRDRHHREWTEGMLRHVMAAVGQTPVVITIDNRTGHTLIGAKLIGFASTRNVDRGVMIEYPGGQRLVHHLWKFGEVIIPLEAEGAKWRALDTYREEIAASYDLFTAKFDGVKPTGTGTWERRVTQRGVTVSYQPRFERDLRNAEPEPFRKYTYRNLAEAELGVLA